MMTTPSPPEAHSTVAFTALPPVRKPPEPPPAIPPRPLLVINSEVLTMSDPTSAFIEPPPANGAPLPAARTELLPLLAA